MIRMSASPLLLISNPKCGDSQGSAFINDHVLPLLAAHGVHVDKVVTTTRPGDAGDAFLSFIGEHADESRMFLILSGGDGTLHEILTAVHGRVLDRPLQISVALVPSGTANALYSSLFASALSSLQAGGITSAEYKLCSINALLGNRDSTVPLIVAKATVRSPSRTVVSTHFSAVVTSTALHASILHDSESLREQVPGIDRFKIAAAKNISRWYTGVVKFRPKEGSEVTIYDRCTGQFVQFVGDDNETSEPTMYGPFAYFLSTVNVDRLEPSFVISPLHNRISPGAMDIIVVRPHRDPSIVRGSDSEGDHLRFAEKIGLALRAAYENGAHINLNYSEDGAVQGNKVQNDRSLVEYIRCSGSWFWLNTGSETAHMCIDGAIVNIEAGGEAECEVMDSSALKFSILL